MMIPINPFCREEFVYKGINDNLFSLPSKEFYNAFFGEILHNFLHIETEVKVKLHEMYKLK